MAIPDVVVVAFRDGSLGGTSRSALMTGRAWRALGHRVVFLAGEDLGSSRLAEFMSVGPVHRSFRDIDLARLTCIHFHHGTWSQQMRVFFDSIVTAIPPGLSVPLITNNIFATPSRHLDGWPGPVAECVLGEWCAYQLFYSNMCRGPWPWTVHNVQDTTWFRPPTGVERGAARQRLGIESSTSVIVRVGSPIAAKWSRDYVKLQKCLRGEQLLVVGAPSSLSTRLEALGTRVFPVTSDEERLRDFYWAADVLALSAARGESFGNVILEALLCGTPVVYRARPFRDNTPWEFTPLEGFDYARSTNDWLKKTRSWAASRRRVSSATVAQVRTLYGLEAAQARLASVLFGLRSGQARPEGPRREPSLGALDRAHVFLLHNLFAVGVKDLKRALPSRNSA